MNKLLGDLQDENLRRQAEAVLRQIQEFKSRHSQAKVNWSGVFSFDL
jgi:hypothetical protein